MIVTTDTEREAMDAWLRRAPAPDYVGEMLKGVLGNHCDGMLIQFDDGCFQLITLVPDGEPDTLCLHEDWNEFLKLVAEYSDYAPGNNEVGGPDGSHT